MSKIIGIILLLVGLSFGQAGIFGTVAAPKDTVTIDSTGAVTTVVWKFNAYPEGVATLFVAGDSTSGVPTGIVGEYQIWYGKDVVGDDLYGVWTAFTDSVLLRGDLDNGAYSSGTMTGRETDLGSVWTLGLGARFRFTANTAAANTIVLVGYLLFY